MDEETKERFNKYIKALPPRTEGINVPEQPPEARPKNQIHEDLKQLNKELHSISQELEKINRTLAKRK